MCQMVRVLGREEEVRVCLAKGREQIDREELLERHGVVLEKKTLTGADVGWDDCIEETSYCLKKGSY